MRPRLGREALITEAVDEYNTLTGLLARTPRDGFLGSCVNSAEWSLKDVLAHVADWAERCEGWCRAGLRGEVPEPPAPGFKWNETPRLNREIYLPRRGHSLARVLSDFEAGHKGLLELARSLDEPALCEPLRFTWTGPTWSVARHIRANTASHYRWASKHFRKWLREHDSGAGGQPASVRKR